MLLETQVLTESTVYWITRFNYLQGASFVISILLWIACIIYTICLCVVRHEDYDKEKIKWNKSIKWSIFYNMLSIILILGSCFIPTTKEYCAIKAIPMIVNDENVQQLPNKVVDLANEWIDELKPANIEQD